MLHDRARQAKILWNECLHMEPEVELLVDGEKVPMNSYVRNVFFRVVAALVSTLKGIDEDWKDVEIKVRR